MDKNKTLLIGLIAIVLIISYLLKITHLEVKLLFDNR